MKILRTESIDEGVFARKYLFESDCDSVCIEVTYIDFVVDKVICASAQAGCARGCHHCSTTYAPKPFIRNLTSKEIYDITKIVIDDVNNGDIVDVLDFSGVGDCSSNWASVRNACIDLYRDNSIARYTFTSIAPRVWCETLYREIRNGIIFPEKITISLHGADTVSRRKIIPYAEDPRKAISWWNPLKDAGCRIVLNYVLHKENSSLEHIAMLAKLIKSNKSWIDTLRVSPINPVPASKILEGKKPDVFIQDLKNILQDDGFNIVCFSPIGNKKGMACGQMRALFQKDLSHFH